MWDLWVYEERKECKGKGKQVFGDSMIIWTVTIKRWGMNFKDIGYEQRKEASLEVAVL